MPGPAPELARDGPSEEEDAHGGDDERQDRQPEADDAEDREREADHADEPGDAADDGQRVGALFARATGRVTAAAFEIAHNLIVSGYARGMDARRLENRLAIAAGMWRESFEEPLPKLAPGDPERQVNEFEMRLVDALCEQATPETAKGIAEKTWDLVHDRPDDDVVKKHVTEWHERLAKMATPGVP